MASEANDGGTTGQAGRLIAIDTPLGADQVLLTRISGTDELSRGYTFNLELAAKCGDEKLQSLLGKPVTVWLGNNDAAQRRPLHGLIRRLICAADGGDREWDVYRAELVPTLWLLNRSADCRIFQHQSIPEILATVFDEHDLHDYVFRGLNGAYPKLDYCVQYRETAFAFVNRLMEHVGLFYWHEHSADRHLLVIADVNLVAPPTEPRTVSVSNRNDLGEIESLEHDYQFRPGKWTLNDYDFESPTKILRMATPTMLLVTRMAEREIYDYPGGFTDPAEGKTLTRVRMEMEEAQHFRVRGRGVCVGFDAGRRFAVKPAPAGDSKFLLIAVHHQANDHSHLSGAVAPDYSNSFEAMPERTPFRPELTTQKPYVRGLQTATVVGPAGENIYCDQYARVRVQFHWDRHGKRTDDSSCWVRVSQTRAGSHYGSMVIPHVGHEVVVSFLEGDPDRPLIIGAVANAMTMPPVKLPGDKDKTIQRDQADNKIIMQAKAGAQHLSLVSPRSLNFFAVRRPAKSLSAAALFLSKDHSINDDVDGFEDPGSLDELLAIFQALDAQAMPANTAGGTTLAGDTGMSETNVAADINSMSEGNINGLSLKNTNTWVYKDSNSWINGNANSQINGNVLTTIKQDATTNVTSTNVTTAKTNITQAEINTTVANVNTTMALANNTWAILNDTVYLGMNATVGLGVNLTFAPGITMQIGGLNYQANGIGYSFNTITIDAAETVKMTDASVHISDIVLHLFL